MIKQLLISIFICSVASASLANEAAPLAQDPIVEQRLIAISEEMRCLVCQNESLAGSRSDLAQDLRREIREQIQQGKSDQQIREFMVERYGDFVLYRPPVKPITWLLWIGPFVILAIGIAVLLGYLRRRNASPVDAALSTEDNQKIDALLHAADQSKQGEING